MKTLENIYDEYGVNTSNSFNTCPKKLLRVIEKGKSKAIVVIPSKEKKQSQNQKEEHND
jgi:hypothetical protein